MPTSRSGLGVAEIEGSGLFAVGGRSNRGVVSTVEKFNGTWLTCTSMLTPRRNFGAATVGGTLYAIGGEDDHFTTLAASEAYDARRDSWSPLPPMAAARMLHGVGVLDGQVYAVGGIGAGGEALDSVEVFDPARGKWKAGLPLTTRASVFGVASLAGRLYAVGGEGLSRTPQVFEKGGWSATPGLKGVLLAPGVGSLAGCVYVAGGNRAPPYNFYALSPWLSQTKGGSGGGSAVAAVLALCEPASQLSPEILTAA